MANIIRVTPERLRSAASTFNSTAGKVNSVTQQMTSIVQSLSGRIWSGEAATAYTSKFNGLQDDITRLYKMISDHSNHLTMIADEYARAESQNAQQSSSLSSDVIV